MAFSTKDTEEQQQQFEASTIGLTGNVFHLASIYGWNGDVDTSSGNHPSFCRINTGVISLGTERQGFAAKHSSLSSAEIKNIWSSTANTLYIFTTWCSIKHWDKFTFNSYQTEDTTTVLNASPIFVFYISYIS